jgi:glycosyltransferase involved in cell wall biosynthesis
VKIAYLLTWADAMGGTEAAVLTLASHLAEHHDVEVISVFRRETAPFCEVSPKVRLRYLVDETGPVRRPCRETTMDDATCAALAAMPSELVDPAWEGAFNRLSDVEVEHALRGLDADVVVSSTPALMALAVRLCPERTITVHQDHRCSELRGPSGEPLLRFAPRLDALVSLTHRTQLWCAQSLKDAAPHLATIPNALPSGYRPRSGLDTRTIVIAGRLVGEKRIDHAVRAFAGIAGRFPGWSLRILGDGPLTGSLRQLVQSLDLQDRIHLLGRSPHMAEEWSKASMCLLTSTSEGFPLVLTEALAAGVPVVAYDCPGGTSEIVRHGVDGFLVPEGDIDSLAVAMTKLMESPGTLREFGTAAREIGARLSPERVTGAWLELFERLGAERDARSGRRTERIARHALRSVSGFVPVASADPEPGGGPQLRELEADLMRKDRTLTRSGARLCVIRDDVTPEDVLRMNLEAVTGVLHDAAIPYALVRDRGPRHRIAVEEEHRAAVLSAIAREFDGRPVYAQPLKPTVCAPPVTLAGQVAGWGDVGGLRVYTIYSVASRALRHGSAFGCDVEFWAPTADGGLRAVRPTLLGRELPREAMRPAKLTVGERSHPTYEPFTRPFVDDITFPIDVVYTWVDGADPGWRARRDETLTGRSAAAEAVTTAADRGDGRYASRDELRYSLRSLDMYAPWVRHIWIVTDQQVPSWLDTSHPRVTVVDHKEIFTDAGALPTFNSHAIESRLHVIPGLSENFIYFNDDFFVGRPLNPDLFFLPSGIPLFFRSPATVLPTPIQEDEKSFYAAAKTTRDIMEREFGCTTANTFLHAPYALRRSVLFELAERFASEITATGRSRVRSREDVSVVSSLHHYHAFRSGKAVPGEISVDYIALGQRDHLPRLTRLLTLRDRDAFCVNDADESDMSEEEKRRAISIFLASYFPVASEFEVGSPRSRSRR